MTGLSRQSDTARTVIWLALTVCGAELPTATGQDTNQNASETLPAKLWTRKIGEDWPTFLGPRRDGKSSERGLDVSKWDPQQGLKLVWDVAAGEGYGGCTVSRGRVYLFDRVKDDNRLRCLNAETGQPLWQFAYPTTYQDHYDYDGGPRCSPLIDGSRIYLFDAHGDLHCLDANNAKVLWELNTRKKFGVVQNFFGVGSNPVIEGDLLILMMGGSPPEDQDLLASQLSQARGNGSAVVAIDKRSGKIRYQTHDELASYASLQLATIHGRRWGFAFARGGLLGFEPASGKIDFHFPWRAKILESVNASMPIVQQDQVLISETYGPGGALLKINPKGSPTVVWKDDDKGRDKSLQTHWNTPVLHQGHVYACSGRHTNDAELRCVEWATGKVKWTRPGLSRTSLTFVDGHLLCLGEYGDLFVLKANPERFQPVAIVPKARDPEDTALLNYPCWAAPVVSHGLMWVRGERRLLCYDLIPQ